MSIPEGLIAELSRAGLEPRVLPGASVDDDQMMA